MNNFFNLLKKHKWAIILAVLVGIIMAFPHIYFIIAHQNVYQGIFMGGLDEEFYLARIQEVRDGYYSVGNALWLEGKDLPYLRPPLSEIVASLFGQLFGLGLINTVLLGNFIFPLLIFLLIYFLVYCLTRDKLASLLSPVLVMLSTNLTSLRAVYDSLFSQKADAFLFYTRLISPQIHTIFFFAFFLFFWLFLKREKRYYGAISAIILGLSFYVYPYTWTFIVSFLCLLALISFFRKNWIRIKSIALILGIAFIIASPYFWNLIQALNHPLYSELSLRSGVIETHAPQLGSTILVLLAIFLLFFPSLSAKRYDYCLAMVLTPFIVLNQQIITGHLLTSAHYHYYYHKPLFFIILIIIIFSQLKKIKYHLLGRKFLYFFFVFAVIILFYNALVVQTKAYQTYQAPGTENQRYGIVFDWLNNNAHKDEVVMANFTISDLVPIYTSLNSVSALDGHYYLIADEEQLLERMFLPYRLSGLDGETAGKFFFRERENISKKIYGQYYRKTLGRYEKIPDEKLYYFLEKYKEFLDIPLKDILKKYQVKYLVWDTSGDPNWRIDNYSFLTEVYQTNNFKIYAFKE